MSEQNHLEETEENLREAEIAKASSNEIAKRADMLKSGESKSSVKKPMRIRLQVLLGFSIFTVVTLILLWVFQVFLLDNFYEGIKKNEVKATAEAIKESISSSDEELLDLMWELFVDTQIDIVQVMDSRGNAVLQTGLLGQVTYGFTSEVARDTHNYSRGDRIAFFELANTSGGIYTNEYVTQRAAPGKMKDITSIIYAVTAEIEGDPSEVSSNQRLILIATEITPVDSTVDTLVVQLTWVTVVMIILAIFLAVYISRKISKPIVSINESAKELAKGDYDIEFAEQGSREVTELAKTLNYAATELSKVDALRSELLANVSHDLRTPLTMIKGYSEVMRDLPGENSPENLQVVIDETSRLNDLVNDLLDLSKLEAGALPMQVSRFNLTQAVRDILSRYDKLADFTFIFEAETDIFVEADELKISQVIYNLVNNAINYVGDDKTIIVNQEQIDNHVRISVTDHGEGISPEKLGDIWDRYYKIDKEHKRSHVGSGLGLSIVKNILDMHGGTYGVTSQVGVGSTFWFEL